MDDTGKAILELISGYANTWRLLLQYDEGRLETPPEGQPSTSAIDLNQALDAIATLNCSPSFQAFWQVLTEAVS